MSARGYGEPVGNEYGADDNDRERWRARDPERSSYRGDHMRDRDEDRGLFERAGDEIRSWFRDEDEDRGRDYGRDYERGYGRPERGFSGGSSWDRDRERGYGRFGRGGSDPMREDRSSFGGMAQGGYGRSSADRDRPGMARSGAQDRREPVRGRPQSWSEANRGESEGGLGYSEFGGTLGGFGNQRFGSSQDDHYRSWRDRQMQELDRDYDDYCREREQQFHSEFDSWRRNRQGRPQGQVLSQQQSDELILGGASAPGSSTVADTSSSTEMAGTGATSETESGSSGGRSGARSRS